MRSIREWYGSRLLVLVAAGVVALGGAGVVWGEDAGELVDYVVAVVGNRPVTFGQVLSASRWQSEQTEARRRAGMTVEECERLELEQRERIRANLVDDELLFLAGERVCRSECRKQLESDVDREMKAVEGQFGGDSERLNEYLRSRGLSSLADLRAETFEFGLRQVAYSREVREKAVVTEEDVSREFASRFMGERARQAGCEGAYVRKMQIGRAIFSLAGVKSFDEAEEVYINAYKCYSLITRGTFDFEESPQECSYENHPVVVDVLGGSMEISELYTSFKDPMFRFAFEGLLDKPEGTVSEPLLMNDSIFLMRLENIKYECITDVEEIVRLKDDLMERKVRQKADEVRKAYVDSLRSEYTVELYPFQK